MKQREILVAIIVTSVIVVKEIENQLEDSFGSIKKSKKILKNIRLVLAILYCMVYYIDVRGREIFFLPNKEKRKMEKKKMDSSTYLAFISRFGVGDVVKGKYFNAMNKKVWLNFRVESLDAFGMYVCLVNKKGQSDRELGLAEEDTLYPVIMKKDVEYPDCGCDREVIVFDFIVDGFVPNDGKNYTNVHLEV